MSGELRILMVEDQLTDAELGIRELKRAGLRVSHRLVETEEAFRRELEGFRPQLIISDFSMPHFDGMWALSLSRELAPDVPFIFVSGTIGEEYAIRALKNGATDYVLKDNLVRLPAAVERALQESEERAARRRAENALRESEEKYRLLWQTTSDAVLLMDGDSRIQYANPAVLVVFGYDPDELIGREISVLQPERFREGHRQGIRRYLETGEKRLNWRASEVVALHRDGREFPAEISFSHVDFGGKALFAGFMRDITERKSQEQKIARLSRIHAVLSGINSAIVRIRDRRQLFEEACRIAVEHGGFGIAWIGALDAAAGTIEPVASAGLETESFLAYSRDVGRHRTLLGKGMVGSAVKEKAVRFSNDLAREDLSAAGTRRREALRRGYRSVIVLPLMQEGEAVGNLSLFAREPDFFDEEEIKLLTELADDISFALEHIAKEEKLNYLAFYDPLTGLPNRTLFKDRLEQRIGAARDESQVFSVTLLDIERFRLINDTLGRAGGDELLRQFAQRLRGTIQNVDLLAHLGGDHFVIATRRAGDADHVAHLLEQILAGVSGLPFGVNGSELRVAARAGVSLYPADGADVDSLMRNAEAALGNAQKTARPYQFYAPQMNARVAEQLKLENDLRSALPHEQFALHYQPRFDLASGRLVGMEALIRWQHPERGLMMPGHFVPLLEELGLIQDVGRWVLRHAALEHAAWCEQGLKPPRIAVNVSQGQLRRRDFVDHVRDALAGVRKAQERVDIEITESMLMEDVEGSIAKLRELQDMGINIAVDDFGTGYSSLAYLARLPIDSLKIDRSFVVQMPASPEQMAIVSTVISLARALNLKVVAEGVETEEQANLLRLLRCDEVQGYLFGRPVPPAELEKLLPQA